MERAILVGLEGPLDELGELASAAGAQVVREVVQKRKQPDPAFFVGRGKAEAIRDQVRMLEADLVIFDEELSPAQVRNLERILETKVVDRSALILDIFSRRARSREGKLQVELAQLNYRMSHLAGRGDWLSRLGGGIGTRGPGETKLEVDRRRIRDRIAMLGRELAHVRKHRGLHRDRRKRRRLPVVSLVGYTNAGKSTLFGRLCGASALASHHVFSTLDPLVRRVRLDGRDVLFSDTVGFIRKLPGDLVAAFRATLEEVEASDLILHVVDASDPLTEEKIRIVDSVLDEIGCGDLARLLVYNKSDLLPAPARVPRGAVLVSALQGHGIAALKQRIVAELGLPDRPPHSHAR